MEPTQPAPQQPPAWHQLDYAPPPQARPRTPRQEPQRYTSLSTDFGNEFRRLGRWLGCGLLGKGRDVWVLGVLGIGNDLQRLRLFLQHAPRWFFITLVLLGAIFDICCAISLRNYFTFYHH